jgi:hypothetical protein
MSATPKRPNPRLALGFLGVVLALQGFYAGLGIFGDGIDASEPLSLVLAGGFLVYAGLIAAFVIGVVRRLPWARLAGMAAAGFGLALAGLQIVAGESADQLFLGMLIDGFLLYYLTKPNVRALFED